MKHTSTPRHGGWGALWIVVLTMLPFVVAPVVLDVLLVVYVIPVVLCCVWAYRRVPRARRFIAFAAVGHTLHMVIGIDRLVGDGRTGTVASAVVMCQAALFFAAALALARARRPEGSSMGLADGFAAFGGLAVVHWQWVSIDEAATTGSVAAQAVVFGSFFALVTVLSIFGGVALDRSQDRWLLATVGITGLLLVTGLLVSENYRSGDGVEWGTACYLVASYLLTTFYRSPRFVDLFEPEPMRHRMFSMRWFGPACALVATPLIILLYLLAGKVPTVWAGMAGAALTGVALWRGYRLFGDREHARRELLEEQRFRALVEHGADVMIVVDADRRISYVSGGVGTPFSAQTEELIGTPIADLLNPADAPYVDEVFARLTQPDAGMSVDRDLCVATGDDESRWVSVHVTNRHSTPSIRGWVLNVHDVTARKRAEQALEQLAHFDSLTGLPNRTSARLHLQDAVISGASGAVLLFCDLDGFKAVNDALGHDSGDEVLRVVAGRWSERLRAHDILARWGGDEFLVICPHVDSDDEAREIADRLVEALREPLQLKASTAQVGVSIGMVRHLPGESVEALVRRADAAMYEAKQARGGVRVG